MDKLQVFLILLTLLCIGASVNSQSLPDPRRIPVVDRKSTNCDTNRLELSVLNQKFDKNELIHVISYPAKGERRLMSKRRIANAVAFMTSDLSDKPRRLDSIIISESNTTEKKGFIDFYVDSQLQLRLHLLKNADLKVFRCVQEPGERRCPTPIDMLFYPCKRS